MEAFPSIRLRPLLPRSERKAIEPNTEAIKQKLLRRGVSPTPKILHALRKKDTQKSLRRSKKQALEEGTSSLSESQKQVAEEEALFRTVSREYRLVKEQLGRRTGTVPAIAGKPWEVSEGVDLSRLRSDSEGYGGRKLKGEHLEELREILAERNGEGFRWLLDDDVEEGTGAVGERKKIFPSKQMVGDEDKIQMLIQRLISANLNIQDWKFSRLMKQSGLIFTEMHLLKILGGLGALGNWRHALSVVEWVYNERDYKHYKSRFVYTKLLAVLGKARRPSEALHIFNMMREDCQIYPDMPTYHTIAVTLGQAGLVKELINIVECMRQKPSKRIKNMKHKNWDPSLEPDLIIYNAVLNACVPSRQWKGVSWVLEQMRLSGLKPTGATYGLAMEVMLKSGKYEIVYKFFGKMRTSGLVPKALTYKVLIRAFWEEGKVDEAVEAVREMEQRGVVGTASVYYELACCLCNYGRWRDAMLEVEKLKKLPLTKPLEVAFTGMIQSSLDGGYISDCISIFGHMIDHCNPNIGTINAMLKVYGRNDMFAKAKELFEMTKETSSGFKTYLDGGISLKLDAYSFSSMLEASACAHQWEYFEYVYKEMALCGYQLDQKKHTWLLIEASRGGKWHLLEHTFDTILEAGEIPSVSVFTEMICHTIAQQNFERAVPLINGMAHASMQVSENQWTNLFQRNSDRISKDKLQNLLNHLSTCNIVMEDPVPTLLKSLESLCRPRPLKETFGLIAPSDLLADNSTFRKGYEDASGGHTRGYLPSRSLMGSDGDIELSADNSMNIAGRLGVRLEEPVDGVGSNSVARNDSKELDSLLHGNSEASSITEATLDLLTGHIGNPCSVLPSASEILDTWVKDRRMVYFPSNIE